MESDSKDAASIHSTPSNSNGLPNEEELVPTLLKGSIDPVYEGKAQVLNSAIQDIGMGWYQWQLFVVVGGLYMLWDESAVFLPSGHFLSLTRRTDPLTRVRLGE